MTDAAARERRQVRRIYFWGILVAAVIVVIGLQRGGGSSAPRGNPDVHARIMSYALCVDVQKDFDVALETANKYAGTEGAKDALAYMDTALKRGKQLGCPRF